MKEEFQDTKRVIRIRIGAAQIYNLFKGLVKKTIKKLLNKQVI
jgi:hypothetical protein